MEKKEIHFYVDRYSKNLPTSKTYEGTKKAIETGILEIHTTSMANMSFDLLDLGYEIWLHKGDKKVNIKPGMPELEKEVRPAHNILKMFMAGVFDRCFE